MKHTLMAILWSTLLGGCAPVESLPSLPLPEAQVVAGASPQLPEDFYARAEVAALVVLTNYLATSDVITQEAGQNPTRMSRWVTPEWLEQELEGFRYYTKSSERTVGQSVVERAVVQLARITPEDILDVGVMACVDTTAVLLLPANTPDPPEEVLRWHPRYEEFDGTEEEWAVIEEFFATVPVRLGDRRTIVFWLVGESFDTLLVDSSEEWWGTNECL
jgi:hypothetical protein